MDSLLEDMGAINTSTGFISDTDMLRVQSFNRYDMIKGLKENTLISLKNKITDVVKLYPHDSDSVYMNTNHLFWINVFIIGLHINDSLYSNTPVIDNGGFIS